MFYYFLRLTPLLFTLSVSLMKHSRANISEDDEPSPSAHGRVSRMVGLNRSEHFHEHRQIINIADRVYVAVGYALSNMIMINGERLSTLRLDLIRKLNYITLEGT